MKMENKQSYTSPEVEVFFASVRLNLLTKFSMSGNGDDWNNGDELDNDLDDLIDGTDWGNGGSVDVG